MKYRTLYLSLMMTIALTAWSQDMTVTGGEAAEGLDLQAVGELFRQSDNSEDFEEKLNDPGSEVNNMDLDANGEVDYIRVVEVAEDDLRVIILQVPLSENEYQDVATIEVEKERDDVTVQIRGNEQIYGANYYVYPPPRISWVTVGFVSWLYRPYYKPWRSRYYWGYYPSRWHPRRPVSTTVYHKRSHRLTVNLNYSVHKTSRIETTRVTKVYTPKSSVRVKKTLRSPTAGQKSFQVRSKTTTTRAGGFGKQTKTTTVKTNSGTAKVAGKRTVKKTDDRKATTTTKSKAVTKNNNRKTAKTKKSTTKRKRKN